MRPARRAGFPAARCRAALLVAGALLAGAGGSLRAAPFAYHTYDSMVVQLAQLESDHPELVEVFTAQDAYTLPPDLDGGVELEHWIVRITNEALGFAKPEVLLVGTQHGDEIVSLEVLLALADLLTDSHGTHPWLTELVDRREIFLVPMANPWGHRHGVRSSPGAEPGTEDMNRDHPYDRCSGGFCSDTDTLSTVGAQAIHELARRHLFRVMLDYHGGVELILHTWGSPLHSGNSTSPDDTALDALGQRMRTYGGPYNGFLPVGTANQLLGPAYGPLDDSAYATTWDAANADPSYPTEGWRSLAYTIEISDDKTPPASTLGGDADLLTPGGLEDGYVPKHVRTALAGIDIAEPYLVWSNRGAIPSIVAAETVIPVEWQVRGCFDVDETRVRWGSDPDPLNVFENETPTQSQTGGEPCFEPPTSFSDAVTFDEPGIYWLTPTARVDQALLAQGNPNPNVAPQSFVVRSRTETGLLFSESVDASEVNTITGQLDWGAEPLRIEVVFAGGFLFGDGFESGGTSAWSLTAP